MNNSKQRTKYNTQEKEPASLQQALQHNVYSWNNSIFMFFCSKIDIIDLILLPIRRTNFNNKLDSLCSDCKKRYNTNVLRLLDCKVDMHKDVVNQILNISPKRIVYVSCNPATQARDIELLSEKYLVTAIQPVDMFPHTHHVENVVRLERK